jgi:hypothetical protein
MLPMIIRILSSAFGLATAIASGFAAYYWFLSSKVETEQVDETQASISDAQELHILDAKVGLYYTRLAMDRVSHLNKLAATWSGVAAGLGAITALLGAF